MLPFAPWTALSSRKRNAAISDGRIVSKISFEIFVTVCGY